MPVEISEYRAIEYATNLSISIIDKQFQSADTLQIKANWLILASALIASLLSIQQLPNSFQPHVTFFSFSIVALISSIILSLLASFGFRFKYIIHPESLWEHVDRNESLEELQLQVIANIIDSYEKNRVSLFRRDRYISYSIIAYVFALLSMGLYLLVPIIVIA